MLNVTNNLDEFQDDSYYAIMKEGEVSGVAMGCYIKSHQDRFVGKELVYMEAEQAENIMWNL